MKCRQSCGKLPCVFSSQGPAFDLAPAAQALAGETQGQQTLQRGTIWWTMVYEEHECLTCFAWECFWEIEGLDIPSVCIEVFRFWRPMLRKLPISEVLRASRESLWVASYSCVVSTRRWTHPWSFSDETPSFGHNFFIFMKWTLLIFTIRC